MILKFPKELKNKIISYNSKCEILIKNELPFNELSINFLNDLSKLILKNRKSKEYPDLITFGFWCREKNILNLKKNYKLEGLFGRGLVCHITPSNVPLNFLYSFAFGLLTGNSNIVKIPSKQFKVINFFFNIFKKIKKNYLQLFKQNIFIRYDKDEKINIFLSINADARLIWGGDNTVNIFRGYKIKPKCLDISFPDRYSMTLIDCKKLANLSIGKLRKLIRNFYNDTYLFDQLACGSPQSIFWINKNLKIIEKFWFELNTLCQKYYKISYFINICKLTDLQLNIEKLNLNKKSVNQLKFITRILPNKKGRNITEYRGRYGTFYEFFENNIKKIFNESNNKIQTITYFGINKKLILKNLEQVKPMGIDRIVPIGSSANISLNWDGNDIVKMLTRKIEVL